MSKAVIAAGFATVNPSTGETRDVELARKIARDLYTGGVFINGFTATNPRVPVGGVKNSGYAASFHTSVHTPL